MANVFKPKRSSTAAKVPTTTDLASGELGVNMADQKVYINNGTSVVQVGTGKVSGAADVTLTSLANGQTLQWNGTAWVNATPAAGGSAGGSVYECAQTISANYTMTTNYNGLSAGPISVASGVTVTIPSGSTWAIV